MTETRVATQPVPIPDFSQPAVVVAGDRGRPFIESDGDSPTAAAYNVVLDNLEDVGAARRHLHGRDQHEVTFFPEGLG